MSETITGNTTSVTHTEALMSSDETPEPWQMKAAQKLGLPTVFLLILLYFIYTAGTWIAHSIAMPLFQKQTEFIDEATDMMSTMSETLKENNATTIKTQDDVDALKSALNDQTDILKSIDASLKQRSP